MNIFCLHRLSRKLFWAEGDANRDAFALKSESYVLGIYKATQGQRMLWSVGLTAGKWAVACLLCEESVQIFSLPGVRESSAATNPGANWDLCCLCSSGVSPTNPPCVMQTSSRISLVAAGLTEITASLNLAGKRCIPMGSRAMCSYGVGGDFMWAGSGADGLGLGLGLGLNQTHMPLDPLSGILTLSHLVGKRLTVVQTAYMPAPLPACATGLCFCQGMCGWHVMHSLCVKARSG